MEGELEVVTQDKFALQHRLLSAEAALAATSAATLPASSSGLNEQALREQLERARDAKMAADDGLVEARALLSQVSLSLSFAGALALWRRLLVLMVIAARGAEILSTRRAGIGAVTGDASGHAADGKGAHLAARVCG